MAITRTVKVTEIRIGTVLDIGKKGVRVNTITSCKHKRRGVRKIHVNDRFCYDVIGSVDIREPIEKSPQS